MRTYILTEHERRVLQRFLESGELDARTRKIIWSCSRHVIPLFEDLILALRALNKFERMRKRERD